MSASRAIRRTRASGGIRGLEQTLESIYSFLIGWREWLAGLSILSGIGILIGGLFVGWIIFMLTRIVEAIVEDWTERDEREGE